MAAMTVIVNQLKIAAALETEASKALQADKLRQLLFEINFDQENRVRVLEGKSVITRVQYRDALIMRYKALP